MIKEMLTFFAHLSLQSSPAEKKEPYTLSLSGSVLLIFCFVQSLNQLVCIVVWLCLCAHDYFILNKVQHPDQTGFGERKKH